VRQYAWFAGPDFSSRSDDSARFFGGLGSVGSRDLSGFVPWHSRDMKYSGNVKEMSITATVKDDAIKLPPGFHVPDGTTVHIIFEGTEGRTLAERYAGLIGITDALPVDMAENHDHYLHGAPKKE
jgi:hypothetical protein